MQDNNDTEQPTAIRSSESRESQALRDEKGRFVKGASGNPGGGPKGKRTALMEIELAVEAYQKANGLSYWQAATTLAMKLAHEGNTSLLCRILDKFVPTKIEADGVGLMQVAQLKIIIPTERKEDYEKRFGSARTGDNA